MKITPQILSIPPYISTSWKNIASLRTQESHIDYTLFITLQSGQVVEVPGLSKETVETVFLAHEKHLEVENGITKTQTSMRMPMGFSLKMAMPGLEGLSSILQHKQEDSQMPDLPHDVLSKISELSNVLSPEEIDAIPRPEPHCNCPHCQITRAITSGCQNTKEKQTINIDEEVTEEDLRFKTWDIEELAKDLYRVSNPLDREEHYNVFLGENIGCTCGSKTCEHIKAVLSS